MRFRDVFTGEVISVNGKCRCSIGGIYRYLASYENGVQFWVSHLELRQNYEKVTE